MLLLLLGVSYFLDHPIVRNEPDTYETEAFVPSGDNPVTYVGNLTTDACPVGTPTGDWLAGCASPDRDEQFDAYVLRHEATVGESTTYTYLIYYRHGENGLVATPELFSGESGGYRIDLTYVKGESTAAYALSYLSVTLPTSEAPRLRLVFDDDTVGFLSTVAEEAIEAVG